MIGCCSRSQPVFVAALLKCFGPWPRCVTEAPPFLSLTGKMDSSWPEFPSATALLSDTLRVDQNYLADRCELWRNNSMFSYAWIN